MIKSILLFILFQWHFALVRTSPNSLMWFSMPFTSPVSHLGIPLSPVSSSCSPLYSPALPHLQPRAAATSFCSHCGLSCLCKCQASSWSFFPSHRTLPLLCSLLQDQALLSSRSQLKMVYRVTFVTFCIYSY